MGFVKSPAVRYHGGAITPAIANSWGWHINWSAIGNNGKVVQKYYYAAPAGPPQRMAMREDNVLRWLLGDHLDSTAITVYDTSKVGELRYRPWGGTRYSGGQNVTGYKFTGQREDAGLGSHGLKPLAANQSWLKPNWIVARRSGYSRFWLAGEQ